MKAVIIIIILFILALCTAIMFGLRSILGVNHPSAKTPEGSQLLAENVHAYVFDEKLNSIYYFQITDGILTITNYDANLRQSKKIISIENIYSVSEGIIVDKNGEINFMGRTDEDDFEKYEFFRVNKENDYINYVIEDEKLVGLRSLEISKQNGSLKLNDNELESICQQFIYESSIEYNLNQAGSVIEADNIDDPLFNILVNEFTYRYIPKALCPDKQVRIGGGLTVPLDLEKRSNGKKTEFTTNEWGLYLTFNELPAKLSNWDSSRNYSLSVTYRGQVFDFGFSKNMNVLSSDRGLFDRLGNVFLLRRNSENIGQLYVIENPHETN